MKIFTRLKHEFFHVLPPTIFFLVSFNVIMLTNGLMLKVHGIEFSSFAGASIAALVMGKVVLITDKLPFINKFPDKPLIYNAVWKTFIYILAVFLFRYVEHLFPFLTEYGSVLAANQHLWGEVVWPRFWAIQIWLLVLFFFYSAFHELVRVIGRDEVLHMFFGDHREP